MHFRRPATASRGFTLIEVMVVLVIVGIVAAGVTLSLGSMQGRDAGLALERFRRVLEATAERAMTRGQPQAIELLADGYRFWAQGDDGNWHVLADPPVFVERTLPPDMAWGSLSRGGQASVGVGQRLAFGTRTPEYELLIRTAQGTARFVGLLSGEVRLEWPLGGTK